MADPDRRAPGAGGEPPLTLGERRTARARGASPVTLIVSLVILGVVIAAVAWLYRSGVRGPGAAPQPVGAPLGDVRVAAPPQSQAPDAAAGLSIYKDQGSAPASPAFAPPPEEPAPRPADVHAAAPATPDATAPPAGGASGAPRGDALGALIDKSTRAADARPRQVAAVAPATPAPQPAAAGADVQIGAFSSAAQADAAWSAAAAAAPGAVAGHGKRVVPMARDGATLYRTFITGFASREAAQSLCDRLQAAGRTCFVR